MENLKNFISVKFIEDITECFLVCCGIDKGTRIHSILMFSLIDIIKLSVVLFVSVFIISLIQTYFNIEKSKKIMAKYNGIIGKTIAALLGTVTPFCSCHSIPIFIGFVSGGLSAGTAFSFLISSPMVDLASFLLLYSIFGIKIALMYIIFRLIIAVLGGTVIEKMKLENDINEVVFEINHLEKEICDLSFAERLKSAFVKTLSVFRKIFPFIVLGVFAGAFIYNMIPDGFIEKILGKNNIFGVFFATIIGIPVYGDIFGVVSVGKSLLEKGAGIGVVLSFMMAVTTLSLPSIIMLSRAVKKRLLTVFVLICFLGIISVGYIFNFMF